MDGDPELAVTLVHAGVIADFRVAPLPYTVDGWLVVAGQTPWVVEGRAAALAARRVLDGLVLARLAAGWRPVDPPRAGPSPSGPPGGLRVRIAWTSIPPQGRTRLGDARALRARGEVAERRGQWAEALYYYRAALRVYPAVGVKRRVARLTARAQAGVRRRRAAVGSPAGRRSRR